MALAIPALQIAAQTTDEVDNTATALLMRSGLERLGQSPAIADALGVIDRAIAAKSGDLDATVESARAALTLSEQARDQFLRDGRSLTESWLNAAFALTRTQQETAPADDDLSLACSDATPTSFCVMWRYDGSVSNPAR